MIRHATQHRPSDRQPPLPPSRGAAVISLDDDDDDDDLFADAPLSPSLIDSSTGGFNRHLSAPLARPSVAACVVAGAHADGIREPAAAAAATAGAVTTASDTGINDTNGGDDDDDDDEHAWAAALPDMVPTATAARRRPPDADRFRGSAPNARWRALPEALLARHMAGRYVTLHERLITENVARAFETHLVPQRTPAWFALRRGALTASGFAVALGFHEPRAVRKLNLAPYMVDRRRALDVFRALRFPGAPHQEPDFGPAARANMDWGTHHEANAAHDFLHQFGGYSLVETGIWFMADETMPCASQDPRRPLHYLPPEQRETLPRIAASPDGLVVEGAGRTQVTALLEIKCRSPFLMDRDSGRDGAPPTFRYYLPRPFDRVPAYYIPQIQGQMMATGYERCYLVSWTHGRHGCNVFMMEYDDEYCALMLRAFQRFNCDYVLRGVEPPENFFAGTALQDALIARTLKLQREAKLLTHMGSPSVALVPAGGGGMFIRDGAPASGKWQ